VVNASQKVSHISLECGANMTKEWSVKAGRSVHGGKVSTLLNNYAACSYPWWSFDSAGNFFGAHDAINDAAATLLGNLGLCIRIANEYLEADPHGNAVGWESLPQPFPFDWHLVFFDCEGATQKNVTRSYGFAHLRSSDVQHIPFNEWWKAIKGKPPHDAHTIGILTSSSRRGYQPLS
jgi:hypothetical protein